MIAIIISLLSTTEHKISIEDIRVKLQKMFKIWGVVVIYGQYI